MFRVPYQYPAWTEGLQVNNPGQGGPASHPHEQATKPLTWPAFQANVSCRGLGAPPRQVLGPTPVPVPTPSLAPPQGVVIPGLQKTPGQA